MVELWGSDLETTYHLGLLKIISFHSGFSLFSEIVIFSSFQFSSIIVRISQFFSSDLNDSNFWLFKKIWSFWINDTILRRDSHFEFCRNGIICIIGWYFLVVIIQVCLCHFEWNEVKWEIHWCDVLWISPFGRNDNYGGKSPQKFALFYVLYYNWYVNFITFKIYG